MVEEKKQPKTAEVEVEETGSKKKQEYLYAVGRRKSAVAQVRVYKKGNGKFLVNEKELTKYFPSAELLEKIKSPLVLAGQIEKLDITAKVSGGGISGQADAVRHGISRALLLLNPNFRKPLKKETWFKESA